MFRQFLIFQWRLILVWALALVIIFLPFFSLLLFASPVEFNQFLVQRLQLRYWIDPLSTARDIFLSYYSTGWNYLFRRPAVALSSLEDPDVVFDYVFLSLPLYVVVYPTEEFYYFSGLLEGGQEFAGNIRFADLPKGRISFAYFPVAEATTTSLTVPFMARGQGDFGSAVIDIQRAGFSVRFISEEFYSVSWKRKTVLVKLPSQAAVKRLPRLKLLPEEEFVGRIADESGIRLLLIYNHQTDSFYDLLDEESLAEDYERVGERHLIGKRTGFLYFDDLAFGRKVLVGIDQKNTWSNNYLDGPGDQVPIRLNLKDKINKAYPNTLLGAGIDEHGVYLEQDEWMRIAISPYQLYFDSSEVVTNSERCWGLLKDAGRSELWSCLTREWWNTVEWRESILRKLPPAN